MHSWDVQGFSHPIGEAPDLDLVGKGCFRENFLQEMMSKCKPEGLAGDNEVKGRDRHSRQRMSKTKHVKAQ